MDINNGALQHTHTNQICHLCETMTRRKLSFSRTAANIKRAPAYQNNNPPELTM